MFAAVFVICNLLTDQCTSYSPEVVVPKKGLCDVAAERSRRLVLEQAPGQFIIMYKCVEFPKAL